ncbi:MAG: hypothetical protein KDB14_18740 [Planctomycetales bacterium]|nr:hypothetical protein [Planctomycetales bacterium]
MDIGLPQRLVLAICGLGLATQAARAAEFVAVDPASDRQVDIVLHFDASTGAGYDWLELTQPRLSPATPESRLRDAVLFLQEGVRRMTGRSLPVRSDSDVSQGIVLVLLGNAPDDIRDQPFVSSSLRDDGSDSYNHVEAFCLISEPRRLLVVANTLEGLVAAMPALLESVGYEVLGMGPNWTHVPADRGRLAFDLKFADRPSFYLRRLVPTSGQYRGFGTIQPLPAGHPEAASHQLTDSSDEPVDASYTRWAVGIRDRSRSMAPFPGHALYQYHRPMVEQMLATGSVDGFLTAGTNLGLAAKRPAAGPSNADHLWINTDPAGQPGHQRVFLSDGEQWLEQKLIGMRVNLDVSCPAARQIVLDRMKQRAELHFDQRPDEVFVFGTEAEDGAGLARIGEWTAPSRRDWYPEYLQSIGREWPQPYALHGYRDIIDQPREQWDHAAAADAMFAFNNWLLSEFDRWVDSLPESRRLTSAGKPKKELVRCSLYSYAYHDIPPHLNLDPRIRIMVAGYPKHRGLGPWKALASKQEVAAAFRQLLPREPSGEYRIPSIAYYADHSLDGIPPKWSASSASLLRDFKSTHASGIRALTFETDFNFGKYGLAYYLMSKVLWNVELTEQQLEAIRDRWLQRAYGSGWEVMKRYYDFMLIDHFPANAPAAWAKAMQWIDEADRLIDSDREPAAQRRLDDLKQYWYFYYLVDTGAMTEKSPEIVEFLWKGQMSYMTAMHMVMRRAFPDGSRRLHELLPAELRRGPAHYTAAETEAWWRRVREHWPVVEIDQFADLTLSDGRAARGVDLSDLVRVADFESLTAGRAFRYNSAQAEPVTFATVAQEGEQIGFRLAWPARDQQPRFYGAKDVPYGVEYWDATERRWESIADVTLSTAPSTKLAETFNGQPRYLAEFRMQATRPGTYRFEVGAGGLLADLGSLAYDAGRNEFPRRTAHTYTSRTRGLTQDAAFFYIPKGTRSLDLEVWDSFQRKQLQLYTAVTARGLSGSRAVDISARGTHRVALKPEETGMLASISGNGFAFPVLYSVPSLWAKCPAELAIPRAIAQADGLRATE